MINEEKLSKALHDFKTKYPSVTSADLQTFIIGWQEALKNCFIPDVSDSFCDSCKRLTLNPTKLSIHYCSCCGDKNYH